MTVVVGASSTVWFKEPDPWSYVESPGNWAVMLWDPTDMLLADSSQLATYPAVGVLMRGWELHPEISPPLSWNSIVSVMSRLPEFEVVSVAV